jgi:anti-anti-sigma regulatory factor
VLIISLRKAPLVDVSTVQAVIHLRHAQQRHGGVLQITGVQPNVRRMFERAGLGSLIDNTHPFEQIDAALERSRRDQLRRPPVEDADEHYFDEPTAN